MFAPLIFGAVLWSRQEPTVSLELRGVRLENAAPILAKTFGWPSLDIGPSLKNEVILVRTKNVDPKVLRDKLAVTLNATWENRAEGWRLTQSDEQKAAEKKIYDKERYKFFSEMTDKAKKRLLNLKPFDEANCKQILRDLETLSKSTVNRYNNTVWRKISKIDEQSPMSRFGYRAALRLTPEVWMRLTEENPKVVFSNRPTPMQQAFPFAINDLLDLAIQEQNQWSTFAAGEPLQGPRAGNTDYEGYYSLGSMNDHRQPFKSTDFTTITMSLHLQNQSVEFCAYDKDGRRTFESSLNFYEYSDEDLNYNYKEEFEKIKKKMVKLQGDAAEYLDLYSPLTPYGQRGRSTKPISQSLLDKMLQPEKIDPLSIAAPDVYFATIDTPNIVMVLNENQRSSRFAEFKEPRYGNYTGKVISDDGTWFLFQQPNPIASRKAMPDRRKLGPIMRFVYKNKRPLSIEEQAELSFSLPWEQDYSWAYQSYLQPLTSNQVENYNDRMGLRIYGSMSTAQRDRARKEGVSLSVLSEDTKREIFRSIFYSQRYESRLDMDYSNMGNMTRDQQKEMNKIQELLWGGIYEEKTFVLPNGLANNFILKIEDNTVSNLYAGRPQVNDEENYYGEGRSLSPNELGQYMFRSQNPTRYRWEVESYNKIDENSIRLASQRSMNMKIQISPMLHFSWYLGQTLITDPKVYTTKTLPQNILDEIAKGYKDAEKNDKQYGNQYPVFSGPRNRGNPPPTS